MRKFFENTHIVMFLLDRSIHHHTIVCYPALEYSTVLKHKLIIIVLCDIGTTFVLIFWCLMSLEVLFKPDTALTMTSRVTSTETLGVLRTLSKRAVVMKTPIESFFRANHCQ